MGGCACGAAVAQWEAAVRPRSVATPVDFNTRLGSKVAWYVVMAGGIVTSSPVPPSATLAPSPHPACACVWPYNSMAARGNSPTRGGGGQHSRFACSRQAACCAIFNLNPHQPHQPRQTGVVSSTGTAIGMVVKYILLAQCEILSLTGVILSASAVFAG